MCVGVSHSQCVWGCQEREHACREVLEMQTAIRSLETRKQEESLEKSKLRR